MAINYSLYERSQLKGMRINKAVFVWSVFFCTELWMTTKWFQEDKPVDMWATALPSIDPPSPRTHTTERIRSNQP